MTDKSQAIILHQYDTSPFSEKVRVVLGIKGLEWHSVIEPVIMPKPELVALTGGYRKIPVMQIGADIYCDSQVIIRELEKRFPSPAAGAGADQFGLAYALGFWADRPLFQAAVAVIFGAIGDTVDEAFRKDREALSGRPFDTKAMQATIPHMMDQLRAHLGWIDEQLADGRKFLFGDRPGHADAASYYNLDFIRRTNPGAMEKFSSLAHLLAWEKRVKAIGHGTRHKMSQTEALDIAEAATATTRTETDPNEPNGIKAGDRVTVMADDYGREPIAGELVSSSSQHVAIRRSDPRVGDVVVHFPRAGFVVAKA